MDDFIQQNAVPNPNLDQGAQSDFIQQNAVPHPLAQGVIPPDKPRNLEDKLLPAIKGVYNAGQSAVIGGIKGVANLADTVATPIYQDITPGNPNTFRDVANKYLPEPNNKVIGATTEGAVTGSPFGTAGAIAGAVSSGGTELLNQERPDHPIQNIVVPMALGTLLAPGTINQMFRLGRPLAERYGLMDRSPLAQAKMDQGITAGTAASTSDNDALRGLQRATRATDFGAGPLREAQETEQIQLNTAINRQADTLFPNSGTKQQVGANIQQGINDGVQQVKDVISSAEQRLDGIVNPKTTMVDMVPFVDRAIDALAPEIGHAHSLIGHNGGPPMVERLMENITELQQLSGSNGNPLRLLDIRKLRHEIGDQLQESLLNGDQSKRQLNIMYGILSDAEDQAYVGTGQEAIRAQLKAASHEFYSSVEAYADPLVKQGMTPEKVAQALTGELKLGDTKLTAVYNLLDQGAPGLKDQFSASILRSLGRDNTGAFSPDRFFKNWQRISPEARTTMFGDINGDIPRAYDQLALLAENQARGARAMQPSETAGTLHTLVMLTGLGAALGAAVGVGGGLGANSMMAGSPDSKGTDRDHSGLAAGVGGGVGTAVGGILAGTMGYRFMGNMLTNPAFLRWLATPLPMDQVPTHIKALGAVAAEAPQIRDEIKTFQNYMESQDYKSPNTLPPERTPKRTPFAEGGPVNSNDIPQMSRGGAIDDVFQYPKGMAEGGVIDSFLKWKEQNAPNDSGADYDLRGAYEAGLKPAENGHWSDRFKLPNHPTFSDEADAAKADPNLPRGHWEGEIFHHGYSPGYAEGGLTPFQIEGRVGGWGTPSPNTKEDLYDHENMDETPVEKSIRTKNSFDENSTIYHAQPQAVIDAFMQEPHTLNDKGQILSTHDMEEPMMNMMQNRQNNDSPVWPHSASMEDVFTHGDKAMTYAQGGPVDPFGEGDFMHPTSILDKILGGGPMAVGRINGPYNKPREILNELDKQNAEDIKYRDAFSTGTKSYLKKGETWRDRLEDWANREDSKFAQGGIAKDPNDIRPFYGKGGYLSPSNGGGDMQEFEVGMYAEGGPIDTPINKVVGYLTQRFPNISQEAARGAAKYMYMNESKLDPNIVNPNSGAYGLAQDLGSRKTALFNKFGNRPSFDQQLQHMGDELETSHKHVLNGLIKAGNNEKQAYDIWGRHFEVPGEAALAKAGIAYKGGDIGDKYHSSNPTQMASNSIIDKFIGNIGGSQEAEDDIPEPIDPNLQAWHDIVNTQDWIKPATKLAIKEVLNG